MKYPIICLTLFTALIILSVNCTVIKDLTHIEKPEVTVQKVRMTGLSFQDISLAFDIGIDNPNKLAVSLAGLTYQLFLNDNSFLQGNQDKELNIEAKGKSMVEIPVTLSFADIYKTFNTLEGQDSTRYRIDIGLLFNLPVLGKTTLPLKKEGDLPLLKWPSIRVDALTVQKFNITSATLNLRLQMKNPNSLNLLLQKINYNFSVNGKSWLNGISDTPQDISSHGNTYLNIPVSLNFLQMGQTLYQMISGQQEMNYNLSGNLNLGSSNELLQNVTLPFDNEGKISVQKY